MLYTTSLNFPNIFSAVSGKTKLLTTFEAINTRLKCLVQTAYSELLGNPNFGCGLYEATFDYANDITYNALKEMIVNSITTYEPSLYTSTDLIEITFDKETFHINIHIGYGIQGIDAEGSTEITLGVQE